MTTPALVEEEGLALARKDEQSCRCEVCKTAPGSQFFDQSWTCETCREIVRRRLRWEPYRESQEVR